MDASLIDTDILSEVLKRKNAAVVEAAGRYLSEHGRLAFSEISFYEIVRGMLAKRADRQLSRFLRATETSDVFPISRSVLMRAARLWSDAQRGGHPKNDADLIIAATALEELRTLVTGNIAHFSWIPGLELQDWRL